MQRLLIVDDDSEALLSLTRALKASGIEVPISGAGTPERAIETARTEQPSVVILDLSLREKEGVESGFHVLSELCRLDDAIRVIVLTGHGDLSYGIKALELGAAHFLQKPADIPHLRALVRDSLTQCAMRRDYRTLKAQTPTEQVSLIIGESPAASKLREEIAYAAHHQQAVLLVGETGSGKGLCAQEIHARSKRAKGNFVRYQTSFATPDLVASDLFGHTKGSFTGAAEERKGLIAEADKGTLFLDEVDQLPLETQVTLLGVLQDKVFRPVGSNRTIPSDFRLVSATNADLAQCAETGTFRRDLFHRIAHSKIHLPALRERLEDIPLLAHYMLEQMRRKEHVQVYGIADAALDALRGYAWPGNVREFESVLEGAAYRAEYHGSREISAAHITLPNMHHTSHGEVAASGTFHEKIEAYKFKLVSDALTTTAGNQVKAAELLQLDRTSLRRILSRSAR